MRWNALAAAPLLLASAILHEADAHTEQQGALQVVHPWVAPAGAGQTTTAKPTISNGGDKELVIVDVTSPVAGSVRMMRDGSPASQVAIAPGETLVPGTVSFVMHDLNVDLPEGKAAPMTIHLKGMAPMTVRLGIGRSTMNPEETVDMHAGRQGGAGQGRGSHGSSHGHED